MGLAFSSPIDAETQSRALKRTWKDSVDQLNDEFKGIYWDKAAETCTEDRLDALVKSTREANKMTAFAMNSESPTESASWH